MMKQVSAGAGAPGHLMMIDQNFKLKLTPLEKTSSEDGEEDMPWEIKEVASQALHSKGKKFKLHSMNPIHS